MNLFLIALFCSGLIRYSYSDIQDLRYDAPSTLPPKILVSPIPDILPSLDESEINISYEDLPHSDGNKISKLKDGHFFWIKDQAGVNHCSFVKINSSLPSGHELFIPLIWGSDALDNKDYFEKFLQKQEEIKIPLFPDLEGSAIVEFDNCSFVAIDSFDDPSTCHFAPSNNPCVTEAGPRDPDADDDELDPVDVDFASDSRSEYGVLHGTRKCFFKAQGFTSQSYEVMGSNLCPKGNAFVGTGSVSHSYSPFNDGTYDFSGEVVTGTIYTLCYGTCNPTPPPSSPSSPLDSSECSTRIYVGGSWVPRPGCSGGVAGVTDGNGGDGGPSSTGGFTTPTGGSTPASPISINPITTPTGCGSDFACQ